jgi:hypothetical protein
VQDKPIYLPFLKELLRDLLANNNSEEVKDVVRVLNTLATEKLAAEKSRPKKKKGMYTSSYKPRPCRWP